MVKGISRDLIRQYLDEQGTPTRVDNDGDLYMVLHADKDFGHNVCVFFIVNNNWLRINGYAADYKVSDSNKGRVLLALNEYNIKHSQTTGILNSNGDIVFKCAFLLDEEVSKEYIVKNAIQFGMSAIWRAFVDFDKM